VTFLSVIYTQKSHKVVFWKISAGAYRKIAPHSAPDFRTEKALCFQGSGFGAFFLIFATTSASLLG